MSDKVSLTSNTTQPQDDIVPTELVPLPSGGIVYPIDSSLFNKNSVEIKSMTARDEDILTSRALAKSGKILTTLLKSCIVGINFDPDKMLTGDRNAILVGIRITGYGAEYKTNIVCSNCSDTTHHDVDLASLPIKRFPEGVAPIEQGSNRFSFVLPKKNQRVIFKLTTGDDEREILATFQAARKSNLRDTIVTTRLNNQIVSIDGCEDRSKLARMIENMPASDSRALRAYIDRIAPGIEMKTSFTCPTCGHEDKEVEVPMSTEFFWPGV